MPDIIYDPQSQLPNGDERITLTEEEKRRPIWELIRDRAHPIPDEDLDRIPHDGAENHDHYLYGAPRKSEA